MEIPSKVTITDENQLILTADLNKFKRFEALKNRIKEDAEIRQVQKALNITRDLSNTIEGIMAGEECFPQTLYKYCSEIMECLTKIKGII